MKKVALPFAIYNLAKKLLHHQFDVSAACFIPLYMLRCGPVLAAVLFFSNTSGTYAQVHYFASSGKLTSGFGNTKVSTDGSGNTYVIGQFSGTAPFGGGSLTSAGSKDIFVAKYNASGEFRWVRRIGGIYEEDAGDIVVKGDYVYVTGSYRSTATFSTYHGYTGATLTGGGAFVAKYDTWSGSLSWALRAGGSSGAHGYGIAADNSGNVYVTGYFYGTATFCNTSSCISGAANTITSRGNADMFIAKYNTAGTLQWVNNGRAYNAEYDYGSAIAVDGYGNIYVTGGFVRNMYFYPVAAPYYHYLPGSGDLYYGEMFVAKYNALGQVLWAQQASGSSVDGGSDIVVDATNNYVYVTGNFHSSTFRFYSTYANTTSAVNTIYSSGYGDGFLAKYSYAGYLQWVSKIGGSGQDNMNSVAINSSNKPYVTGSFTGSCYFYSTSLTASGGTSDRDLFVARFNETGTLSLVLQGGGTGSTDGHAIGLDNSGNAYITGYYSGNTTFGSTPVLTGSGSFLTKVSPFRIYYPILPIRIPYIPSVGSAAKISAETEDVPAMQGAQFNAYPVPSTGNVTIEFIPAITAQASVEVYDLKGILVTTLFKEEAKADIPYSIKLDGSNLAPGTYIVKLIAGGKSEIKKIIIAR